MAGEIDLKWFGGTMILGARNNQANKLFGVADLNKLCPPKIHASGDSAVKGRIQAAIQD